MIELKYKNNEELVLQYQNGDDYAFSELFEINQGLIREMVNKYKHVQIIDEATIISACNQGFMNASRSYKEGNKTKFSSYCMRIMEREIIKELTYFKQAGRGEMIKNSEYMNRMIQGKEGETEALWLLDAQETEEYFEDKFLITQEAIRYALEESSAKFKDYIVPILCEEYEQAEVGRMFDMSRQSVDYHVRRFKEYMKEYMEYININSLQEALN